MTHSLRDMGDALAALIAGAAPAVLHVERGRGIGATGFAVASELAVASSAALVGDSGQVLVGDERRDATVVGRDPGTDIALLRVSGGGMTPLASGDAGGVKVGHLAIALGRPGASVRASLRMVGALAGEVRTPTGGRLDRYLETDRRLPRGFSGGPLVGAGGELLGMNTAALIRGAGLAVPIETITRVIAELERHGSVRTAYLGVRAVSVRLPRPLGAALSQRRGALVVSVVEGGPAETAGLVLGDVIVSVSGEPIEDPMDLRAALAGISESSAAMVLVRAGEVVELDVTLGQGSER